ncbi:3-oxoacyl-[acyl-carrier-protein] reductase [Pectinatus haikarae]|uniref:3-oxoacyl-[acyl-carrier-protein] reductase n=1 Tax=Pectinatus haikarae TaxID=349096 RepID=A0ABT9Y4P9_9FIRM|nr:3-oxoacyl-[acyl-carrier-protein] reductase [Pectinatus haikarae]MDQ0202802.1 3-oxoacyl-[acyl-carrier protein] reductase [Pectinatus haikarae]
MLLEGKVALVTGASRGIGRSIALSLAANGALVAVNYAGNTKAAEAVKAEIIGNGGKAIIVKADVSDEEAAGKMIDAVIAEYGTLDILVNNAGITRDTLLARMKKQDWDAVINTNLTGVFNCTKIVAKLMMKKRAGRIINMASVVGMTGNIGQANYAAAKAGVIGFTKSLARELAARGITVNAVAPGFISTDMTSVISDKAKENILSDIPLGKMGSPEDVANTVLFLVSDRAAYITGQVINVDGGMVM